MTDPSTKLRPRDHTWSIRPEGHQLNLVVKGPACEVPGGLSDQGVRDIVLQAMQKEGQVDLITLEGQMLRQYEGLQVLVMNHLLVLSKELEGLRNSQVPQPQIDGLVVPDGDVEALIAGLRQESDGGGEPAPEEAKAPGRSEPGPTSDHPRDRLAWVEKNRGYLRQEIEHLNCEKCAFFPAYVFETLYDKLVADPNALPELVGKFAADLAAGKRNLERSKANYCDRCLGVTGAELESVAARIDELVQSVMGATGSTSTSAPGPGS